MKRFKTRSSDNWNEIPGGFYALNQQYLFDADNDFNIPALKKNNFIPEDLIKFGSAVRRHYKKADGKTVHFFLDDYKFESLWNRPEKSLSMIQKQQYALTPDFSLFIDYPRAMQIWNTYRSRWLGRYWQLKGVRVLPTVSWGDKNSYDFCFLGIPENHTVAISTVGLRKPEAKEFFNRGFKEMIKRLSPKDLVVYGEIEPIEFEDYVDNVHWYETFWSKNRERVEGD